MYLIVLTTSKYLWTEAGGTTADVKTMPNKDCKKKQSYVDVYLIPVIHTSSQPFELATIVILTVILVNTRSRASLRTLGDVANLLHFRQSVKVGLISNSFIHYETWVEYEHWRWRKHRRSSMSSRWMLFRYKMACYSESYQQADQSMRKTMLWI